MNLPASLHILPQWSVKMGLLFSQGTCSASGGITVTGLLVALAPLLVTSTGSVTIHHQTVPALPLLPPTSPGLSLILHPQHPRCRALHPSPAHLGACNNPHPSSKEKGCLSFSLSINDEKPSFALVCLNAPVFVNKEQSEELEKFNLL